VVGVAVVVVVVVVAVVVEVVVVVSAVVERIAALVSDVDGASMRPRLSGNNGTSMTPETWAPPTSAAAAVAPMNA
jgi:hypothetical protein